MKNDAEFKEYMAILATVFHTELTTSLIKIYWEAMRSYTDEQFAQACDTYIKTGRFFPKPVELIELIEGDKSQIAAEAWETVLKGLRDSKNVAFSPEITKAVNLLGGAEYLGSMNNRDLEFKRNQFMEIYQSVSVTEANKLEHSPLKLGVNHG